MFACFCHALNKDGRHFSLTLNKLQQKRMLEERLSRKRAQKLEALERKQLKDRKVSRHVPYPTVHLSVQSHHLSCLICPSVQSICLSNPSNLSVCPSVCLSIVWTVCQSDLTVCLSNQSVCSICLSNCPICPLHINQSICLPTCSFHPLVRLVNRSINLTCPICP